LLNRNPTKAICGRTPYEAWSRRKPEVTNFKVFGCLAYALVPDTDRHKLEAKSRKCIFIGYSTELNAYKLYDPLYKKMVINRDVICDERLPHVYTS